MIIHTPLALPKIEPDDWAVFWNIWNQYSAPLIKVQENVGFISTSPVGRNDIWNGLDIYKPTPFRGSWEAPFYNIKEHLPNLYNMISSLPIPNIRCVRLVSSTMQVPAHSDDNNDIWVARAMFYYTATTSQWFFTKPEDPDGKRTYISYPDDTNWFAYNDMHCWHGTDYDAQNPKILLQVFSSTIPKNLINASIARYRNYTIVYK